MKITTEQIMMSTVRMLTLNEPLASLMAFHDKAETRTRNTQVRGLVCIHAAKKAYPSKTVYNISGYNQYQRIQAHEIGLGYSGFIIGIGRLISSNPMYKFGRNSISCSEIENKCFVKYNHQLFVWEFEDMTPVEPVYMKGKQGWKILTHEQKALLKPL